jgi:hypothetical protein
VRLSSITRHGHGRQQLAWAEALTFSKH